MRKRIWIVLLIAPAACCLLTVLIYNLPAVHDRLGWRIASLQSQIYYFFNPPAEIVFTPQQQADIEAYVQATLAALVPTPSGTPSPSPTLPPATPGATATASPSPTPVATFTPIPDRVILNGLLHEYQQMNNCGPTTLAMALTYWGWQGNQTDTRAYLRPSFATVDDKNVNPIEMADYVENFTGLKALVRVGGDLPTLKRLVAAGYPVVVEKGLQPPKEDWMGHYAVINGYDDGRGRFITQDSYIMADFPVPYDQLSERWWRDFNYVYLVIYPPEREGEVLAILGEQADPVANFRHAEQLALQETQRLQGRDLYFAWFNLGSSRTAQGAFAEAAQAYDQAFAVYAALPEKERPWRVLWYQSGPYEAYYHTGRYQDVINLANTTLAYLNKPVLEEAFYWRGLAREALGDIEKAIQDLQKAAKLNPNYAPPRQALGRLGVESP